MISHRLPNITLSQFRAVAPHQLRNAITRARSTRATPSPSGIHSSPTRAYRHARLWQWIGTDAPLGSTRDLHTLHIGTGITKAYPAEEYYLPEVTELGALFAWRNGSVTCIDPNRDVAWLATRMQAQSLITAQHVPERNTRERRHMRRSYGAHDDDVLRYQEACAWVQSRMYENAHQLTPEGTALLLNQFRRRSQLIQHQGTLLSHVLPAQAYDLCTALYVMPYMQDIEEEATQAAVFATVAHSTRIGGLLAFTNLDPQAHALLLHYGCSPIHQITFRRNDEQDATGNTRHIPPEYRYRRFTIDIFARREFPQTQWAQAHLETINDLNSTPTAKP